MELKGSIFLVTGGSSGLGAATVKRFHAAGARVVIADVDADAGLKMAAQLGSTVAFVKTDVTSESEARAAVDAALSQFGGLNGLVNCAGIGPAERVIGKKGTHRLESFTRVINVNLIGAFNML